MNLLKRLFGRGCQRGMQKPRLLFKQLSTKSITDSGFGKRVAVLSVFCGFIPKALFRSVT
jgi:hypothetical protein